MKPRLVILDADAVIHLCEIGKWGPLVEVYEVVLPETVAYSECLFTRTDGRIVPINIREQEGRGLVRIESASQGEVEDMVKRLGSEFNAYHELHIGELEAMVVLEKELETAVISTGDTAAVKALCFLDHSSRLISVEALLQKCGHTASIHPNFSEEAMKRKVRMGQEFRIKHGSIG